jgi:hypothetical protein
MTDACMDVYLVPVGDERHELYCEVADEPEEVGDPPKGMFRRLRQQFSEMLAEAERERREGSPAVQGGWMARSKARLMRWVAESIAEQRLLWHLRRQTEACLFHPDDVDEQTAMAMLRASMKSDFEKHRFWLIIDTLGFIASAALTLLPGPNLVAYYFAFRLVGHYLSMRGARQGLTAVTWRSVQSPLLSELRHLIRLEPEKRGPRVRDVAVRLRLEHLATFVERMAVPAP